MISKGVLLVDDEAKALKYFARAFGDRFPVFSATSAAEALQVLTERGDEIGVVVSDQRMPESSGVELLRQVRDRYPNTVRVLTTAYSDQETLVGAINSGAVYSFVSKPWEPEELVRVLGQALKRHEDQLKDELVRESRLEEWKTTLREERAHEVGHLALKLGHYVNNALSPVAIMLDLMLERPGRREPAYQPPQLRRIRDNLMRVSHTLMELNQLSQPVWQRDTTMLDLGKLFRVAMRESRALLEAKSVTVEKSLPRVLPKVRGVHEQIEKLFRFMISEEAVSLPAGSRVAVRFTVAETDGEPVGVTVEFEDFVPLPPRFSVEEILHPFNLRGPDPKDLGLFLCSCYFIARNHGGSLKTRVKGTGGVVYSLFLPTEGKQNKPGRAA